MRLQSHSEDSCRRLERVSVYYTKHEAFDAQKQTEGQPGKTGDNLEWWGACFWSWSMMVSPMTTWKSIHLHNRLLIQDTPRTMPMHYTSVTMGEGSRRARDFKIHERRMGCATVNERCTAASDQADKTLSITGPDATQSHMCFEFISNLSHHDQGSNSCQAEER